jgi:hypothetical protein
VQQLVGAARFLEASKNRPFDGGVPRNSLEFYVIPISGWHRQPSAGQIAFCQGLNSGLDIQFTWHRTKEENFVQKA